MICCFTAHQNKHNPVSLKVLNGLHGSFVENVH